MSGSIRTNKGWVHTSELMRHSVRGREDSLELRARCVDYLTRTHPHLAVRQATPPSDRQLRHAVAQAAVLRVVGNRNRETDSQGAVAERERTIREQAATIDRLLAYVPTRARQLSEERLSAIVLSTLEAMGDRGVRAFAHVTTEEDFFTTAAHRLVFMVQGSRDVLGSVEDAVLQHIAAMTAADETPSLSVVVTAVDGPSSEP